MLQYNQNDKKTTFFFKSFIKNIYITIFLGSQWTFKSVHIMFKCITVEILVISKMWQIDFAPLEIHTVLRLSHLLYIFV